MHTQNSFITLTYAEEHLPSDGSLIPWHFTDFMKRLRYHFSSTPIKYFMCGEYGEKFSRPHYHACLFGIDFLDKDPIREDEGIILYNSPTLDDIWSHGFASIGAVTFETAAYTARYITKKITGEKAHDHYQTTCEHTGNLIRIEPEYTTMSLRPGIGKRWLDQYKSDIYPSGFTVLNKRKLKPPRYYDSIMELEGYDIEAIKLKRKKIAAKHLADNTPERLETRHKVQQLKFQQLHRGLEKL